MPLIESNSPESQQTPHGDLALIPQNGHPATQGSPGAIARISLDVRWQNIRNLVLDSVTSRASKRAYGQALDEFLAWYQREQPASGLSKATVQRYRAAAEARGLAASTVNVRLAALRKLATEAADSGLLNGEIARAIRSVRGAKKLGTRIGNWLSHEQAQELLDTPGRSTLKGLRDTALLAVLLGAGLRRSEVVSLCIEHLQQREGRWIIADLIGKGGRVRSVPIAAWIKAAIDRWLAASGIIGGCVFRPVNKGGNVRRGKMSEAGVYAILRKYAKLAPHDLRRTFAQLARKAGCNVEQIQQSLGHASIQTTERYLGIQQDLADSPSDRIRLRA
jgi:site-specific recombinase XerD